MRTSGLRRCAPGFPLIHWRGNVFRPLGPIRPWRTGHSGRDASDPPVRGPGTGSGPSVLAHPPPPPSWVASVPAIPAGRRLSAASRRRNTRSLNRLDPMRSAIAERVAITGPGSRLALPYGVAWIRATRRGRPEIGRHAELTGCPPGRATCACTRDLSDAHWWHGPVQRRFRSSGQPALPSRATRNHASTMPHGFREFLSCQVFHGDTVSNRRPQKPGWGGSSISLSKPSGISACFWPYSSASERATGLGA